MKHLIKRLEKSVAFAEKEGENMDDVSWGQKHNLRKLDDDILERQIIVGNIYDNPELVTEPS